MLLLLTLEVGESLASCYIALIIALIMSVQLLLLALIDPLFSLYTCSHYSSNPVRGKEMLS